MIFGLIGGIIFTLLGVFESWFLIMDLKRAPRDEYEAFKWKSGMIGLTTMIFTHAFLGGGLIFLVLNEVIKC